MNNGQCDGDCVTSVGDCAGGDGKAPCATVLSSMSNVPQLIRRDWMAESATGYDAGRYAKVSPTGTREAVDWRTTSPTSDKPDQKLSAEERFYAAFGAFEARFSPGIAQRNAGKPEQRRQGSRVRSERSAQDSFPVVGVSHSGMGGGPQERATPSANDCSSSGERTAIQKKPLPT